MQEVERTDLYVGEGQQAGETVHVLRLDLVVADAHDPVHLAPPAAGGLGVQREDDHPVVENLLQPLDLLLALVLALPAVLVVHVENQADGHLMLHQAGQQRAGEESLAGAGLAEDAGRPLDESVQVEGDVNAVHLQRVADVEVPLLPLPPEDEPDLLRAGLVDGGEVGRDGLDRSRLLLPLVQHQHGRDVNPSEDGGALVDAGQEGVGGVRGRFFDERVQTVQFHIGDDGEEAAAALSAHDDVTAHRQPLDDRPAVEFDVQPFGEAPADDEPQSLGRGGRGAARAEVGGQFLFRGEIW